LASPVRAFASATNCGGDATSVVTSLMGGRLISAGRNVSGQAISNRGSRTPKAALPAPPKPRRQICTSAMSPASIASPAPAAPTANRLSATRVGNEVSRCSTTPTTMRLAENMAILFAQRASGASMIVDRSFIGEAVQSLRS